MDRLQKESFVSGHSGTTWTEIFAVISTFWICRVVFALLSRPLHASAGSFRSWALGLLTVLTPSILSTWQPVHLHAQPFIINLVLFLLIVALWAKNRNMAQFGWTAASSAMHLFPKPYLSIFRGGLTAYTCVAILAVDFQFFPRRFAKAETYGSGFMDVGPGMFVLSSGLSLGLRLSRAAARSQESEQRRPTHSWSGLTLSLLARVLRSSGPLLLLGVARLALTKAVDYQVHASEYGIHWNFFFTLTVTGLTGALLPIRGHVAGVAAGVLCTCHQVFLQAQPWVLIWLEDPVRDVHHLVDANKEGLCSLLGYIALFYFGVWTASLVQNIPSSQQHAQKSGRRSAEFYSQLQWHARLIVISVALWIVAFGLRYFVHPVSRRFCNATYVVWVTALSISMLELSAVSCVLSSRLSGILRPSCDLVDGLSKYQLLVFLVANLGTGFINLSIDTLTAGAARATAILFLYCIVWASTPNLVNAFTACLTNAISNVDRKIV